MTAPTLLSLYFCFEASQARIAFISALGTVVRCDFDRSLRGKKLRVSTWFHGAKD
jgi:hypothetical protein